MPMDITTYGIELGMVKLVKLNLGKTYIDSLTSL
jgi:hypothetical protein